MVAVDVQRAVVAAGKNVRLSRGDTVIDDREGTSGAGSRVIERGAIPRRLGIVVMPEAQAYVGECRRDGEAVDRRRNGAVATEGEIALHRCSVVSRTRRGITPLVAGGRRRESAGAQRQMVEAGLGLLDPVRIGIR